MTDWGKLRPVGIKEEKGEKKLAMTENGSANGIVWEIVDVTFLFELNCDYQPIQPPSSTTQPFLELPNQ